MPSEATKAVRNFRDAQEPRRRYWQGWMIDFEGIGSSEVTDEPGKVYVRLDRGLSGEASGEIIKAYARIRPIPGWAVWVGTTPYRDWEYTVMDVDLEAMGGAIDGVPMLEPHHITHEWGAPSGSDDTVFSKFLQLYDFSVWPYSGLVVEIKGGQFDPSGTTQTLNQTLVDLSGYQPDYGCLYALICISPTGTIEVVPGQAPSGFLSLLDIPAAPSNDHWEIAAVRLCAGVDTIIQTPRDTNITDLRFANMGWAGKRYGGHNPVTLDANAQDLMTLTDQDIGLQVQPSGTVYAAPTGGNGIPDFRFLADSDIPDIHSHYPGSIPLEDLESAPVTDFLSLTDTPGSYAGEANKGPIVNAGEDALEFTAVLLADGTIAGATAQAQDFGTNGIKTNEIAESTADTGVYFPNEVGIGLAPTANQHMFIVQNLAIDSTLDIYGISGIFTKTAGTSDYEDDFFGAYIVATLDQSGGEIGHLYGSKIDAAVTDGTIGAVGNVRNVYGVRGAITIAADGVITGAAYGCIYNTHLQGGTITGDLTSFYTYANLDSGTVTGSVFGARSTVDIESGMTSISGSVYGMHIFVDDDQGAAGTVYGLYLNMLTGVDYAIYAAGNAPSYHSGIFNIAGGVRTKIVVDDVADPPTDAQLDAAFGTPATVGEGFVGIINDADAGINTWIVVASDGKWWHLATKMTLAE